MALTQTDLDALDAAIASGVLTVRTGDRTITYQSIAELKAARDHVVGIISEAAGKRRPVFYFKPAGRRD
jgi:hypothetical protein